jgi:hypothetical protein
MAAGLDNRALGQSAGIVVAVSHGADDTAGIAYPWQGNQHVPGSVISDAIPYGNHPRGELVAQHQILIRLEHSAVGPRIPVRREIIPGVLPGG